MKSVINDGSAHKAGIASGDLLVSINQRRLTEKTLQRFKQSFESNDPPVEVVGFRAESFMTFQLVPDTPEVKDWEIYTGEESKLPRPWEKGALTQS